MRIQCGGSQKLPVAQGVPQSLICVLPNGALEKAKTRAESLTIEHCGVTTWTMRA